MSDTPESVDPDNKKEETKPSLLDEIVQMKKSESATMATSEKTSEEAISPIVTLPKKPREPISFGDFMKFAGSLFFVAVIFFGSFLAYIVFNPDQAGFFNSMFGIDRNDIATILKKLINGSFGVIIFILSIVWIISLFRAIWTPKDLKRKRLLSGLTAALIGIVLFSILSLWALLFSVINATDYTNPEGSILLYDNELYQNPETRSEAPIDSNKTLIGPITILFDLESNADKLSKTNGVTIQSYRIDADGATCNDGGSIVIGNVIGTESSIICTFDSIKSYDIRGEYTIVTRTGEEKTSPMMINPVDITGLVKRTYSKNIQGKDIVTLDASGLKSIGNPRWKYIESGKIVETASITEEISATTKYVCLVLVTSDCDRLFVLRQSDVQDVTGSISAVQDSTDPLLYRMSLSGASIDLNQVTNIEWLLMDTIGGQSVICTRGNDVCNYRFNSYGEKSIHVRLEMGNGEKYDIERKISLNEPLKLSRNMKVMDSNGAILNTSNTYQSDIKAYVIENTLTPPTDITLDARDITTSNDGYVLSEVLWKISDGKTIEEKRGERIGVTLDEPLRYTIEGIYTFKKTSSNETATTRDLVIIDIERKSLMPRINVSTTSDYVPSIVTIDASESQSENGEIKKFIFDFGEGKTPAEGDAVQQYEYITAGEKKITVTIISESGERATVQKTVVLKDEARTIGFTPSMTPAVVNTPIDFEANGTNGQVQEYIWNFGDNTPTTRGYAVSHTYSQPGLYIIELTVVYTDGTQDSLTKKYEVVSSLE